MQRLLDVGDSLVACTVTGTGPPLVLMHGAEGDHHMFDVLVPHLAPHFTVIAYDQRDCGGTLNSGTPSTLTDLANDAKHLLQALGHSTASVYGTSFGGRVAQALAHHYPEVITRLVLGGTWPLPLALEDLNAQNISEIKALREKLPDSAEALAEYFLPKAFLDLQPQFKSIFRNAKPQSEKSRRRFHTVADHPALEPHALRVATLVLAGELDRVVPPAVTLAMGRQIPGAQTVLIPGAGHAAALQVPNLIAAHICSFCLTNAQ